MRPILLVWTLAVWSLPATAAVPHDVVPYTFQPYDSLPRAERYLTRAEYDSIRVDRSFGIQRIRYESGQILVSALVASPQPKPAGRLPTVVFVRGGYTVGDVGWQVAAFLRHMVRAGFVVVAPMLRGSDGAEGHDELGGADLDDVRNAIAVAHAMGIADTSRLFLTGESRGGAMAYIALRQGFPARAAAVWGAFTDLDSLMEGDPKRYSRMGPIVWPGWPRGRAEIADARSAARWPGEIRAPVLILHGGADDEVPLSHPLRLVMGLERVGRSYRFLVFGGERHTLRGAAAERDAEIVRWFRHHDAEGSRLVR
jgi:dipeptidyl aminopeptidase/acylaminoacyl peptidase